MSKTKTVTLAIEKNGRSHIRTRKKTAVPATSFMLLSSTSRFFVSSLYSFSDNPDFVALSRGEATCTYR